MKIYFAGSIRGGRTDAQFYADWIEFLKCHAQVLTEHIGNPSLTQSGDEGASDRYIHDRDMDWLLTSDILVAEVTTVSMGVGYEIGRAVAAHIPVICLYRQKPEGKLSAMIAGCPDVRVIAYDNMREAQDELLVLLQRFKSYQHF